MAAGQNLAELDNRIKIRDNIQATPPIFMMNSENKYNIQAGRVQESIALVNEQHPALLDSDRYLLFHLQQQQLIELIREQVFQFDGDGDDDDDWTDGDIGFGD